MGVDLRDRNHTLKLFEEVRPTHVINCSAYVGGLQFGYKHPAELFFNNMQMCINILEACRKHNIVRLVNPISNCSYPAKATLFKEDEFWDGELHESVLSYGFARKASWVGSWAYNKQYGLDTINLILSNMYGDGDHFEEERSHAMGALIMKIVEAKKNNLSCVNVWGTGNPVREWLHVNDGAESLVRGLFIAPHVQPINIGVSSGISISEMVNIIKNYVAYDGEIIYDDSKPDGAPYKTVDGSKCELLLGWKPTTNLIDGIHATIDSYIGGKI
jgi:GDP-L-fucose synthase